MLMTIDAVLTAEELHEMQTLLAAASWQSGKATAGSQAALVKDNEQLPESCPALPRLRQIVTAALSRHAMFFSAALPLKLVPPNFNRYSGASNAYGWHTDNALHSLPDGAGYARSDVSATLFLSEPEEYEGGVLTIEDTFGRHGVKLKAGSLVLYPSSSIHEVSPVTRGTRLACFMFMQSMVRDPGERRILFDLDMSLLALRQQLGETAQTVSLTGMYHNLLRRWSEQ